MADDPTDPAAGRDARFDDELVGLDPDDPEAQEFAAHLDRMKRPGPSFTIEGSLRGVEEFADGAGRAGGLRWLLAVLVVLLIVGGVLWTAWDTLGNLVAWLAR